MRQTPMYKALTRVQLLLGADRNSVLTLSMASLFLGIILGIPYGIVAGALFFLAALPLLIAAAKRDPKMIQVYRRHIEYQDYYPANPYPARKKKKGRREY